MKVPDWIVIKIDVDDFIETNWPNPNGANSFCINRGRETCFLSPPLLGRESSLEGDREAGKWVSIPSGARMAWLPKALQTELPDYIYAVVHPEDIIPNWDFKEYSSKNEEG